MKHVIIMLIVVCLTACGQTGRLYLPEKPTFAGETSESGTL
ncbi:MAG: lipoprotein [Gammaproteobacteria bacterium]